MADQKNLTISIVGKDDTKQAFDSVNKNLSITEKQASTFGKTMDGISSSLSSFGKKMSIGVTAPLVALGGFATPRRQSAASAAMRCCGWPRRGR